MAYRRTTDDPGLKPATVAILLRGWGARAPEPSDHGFGGGLFELFEAHNAGMVHFWREHTEYLRRKAAEWGWPPTFTARDGRARFYAEYIADGFGEPDLEADDDQDEAV